MTSFMILVSSTLYESVIPILEIITDQAMYVKAFVKGLKGVLGRQILMFGPCRCRLILQPLFYFYKPNINWEQGTPPLWYLLCPIYFSSVFRPILYNIIDIWQQFFLRTHLIFPCWICLWEGVCMNLDLPHCICKWFEVSSNHALLLFVLQEGFFDDLSDLSWGFSSIYSPLKSCCLD